MLNLSCIVYITRQLFIKQEPLRCLRLYFHSNHIISIRQKSRMSSYSNGPRRQCLTLVTTIRNFKGYVIIMPLLISFRTGYIGDSIAAVLLRVYQLSKYNTCIIFTCIKKNCNFTKKIGSYGPIVVWVIQTSNSDCFMPNYSA